MTYVVKKYEKFKSFQEELKKVVVPHQGKDAAWKAEGEKLVKELQEPTTTDDRREQIEKRIVELKRLIDDNKKAVDTALIKEQERQLKVLYLDVQTVVSRYAKDHDLELVLHFNDASTPQDYWSPKSIGGKMQTGGAMPIYSAPGVDISKEIASILNDNLKREKGK